MIAICWPSAIGHRRMGRWAVPPVIARNTETGAAVAGRRRRSSRSSPPNLSDDGMIGGPRRFGRWSDPGGRRGGGMRLWGGRFAADSDEQGAAFRRSIHVDAVMAADAIAGSVAHVRGL